ncbi:p-hydroxycinnamoyl CoA hydratase/lyase [Homoserinimonas sp. OAct 916]|uniref:p-hydroxycinnamoyl CoA hydratase/lyase n=1 Tax=Homoserinimonas sp. OAct 916 TaxID=2211450 RepID=UPI0013007163|nr:p-hydroxycinnamoyl CoA hydratase/lyase [Homoserinimonas sp. OAct 916]
MTEKLLSTVKIERNGDGIAWVYINRPEKRNAMSPQVHRDMSEAFDELELDDDVKIVVIAGEGGVFSAGQDLKETFRGLENDPAERFRQEQRYGKWRWERLWNFPKVTIAMVDGWCVGGAFTHFIACDFAITSDEAQYSLSEVNWGIIPGGMVSKAVVEAMGYRAGLYYCMTGERFDGARAVELGLANFAVPSAELKARTQAFAEEMMKKNQNVVVATKQVYRAIKRGMDFDQSFDYMSAKFTQLKATDSNRGYDTGLSAFVDEKSYRPAHDPYPMSTAE